MKNINSNIIKAIMTGFQNNKGKGSFYCFDTKIIPEIIYNVLVSFNTKHPNEQIFIVVDCYETRQNILNYIKNKNPNEENKFNIKILSRDYVKYYYHYNYKFIITVGVNNDIKLFNTLHHDSKFTLAILTKNIMDTGFITNLRKVLPDLNVTVDKTVVNPNIYSPVEEHRVGVDMTDEDKTIYDKYTEYINTSIAIFGNLYNIEKCKKGDEKLGITSAQFREQLAKENGWREDLDTNIPFIKQIDDIYNPNILFERACNFYNIAKQRRDFVTDNECKLSEIYRLCCENKDKKILIISKRASYAAKVTEYINSNAAKDNIAISCKDYHDAIEDAVAVDDNGYPILVKSGLILGSL